MRDVKGDERGSAVDLLRMFSVLFWLWKERSFERVDREALVALLGLIDSCPGAPDPRTPGLVREAHGLLGLGQASLFTRCVTSLQRPAALAAALGLGPARSTFGRLVDAVSPGRSLPSGLSSPAAVHEEIRRLDALIEGGWVADVGTAATYGLWLRYFAPGSERAWSTWESELSRCDSLARAAVEQPIFGDFLRRAHELFVRLVEVYWAGRLLLDAPDDEPLLGEAPAREDVLLELDQLDARIADLRRPFRHPWLSLEAGRHILQLALSERGRDAVRREARTLCLSRPLFPSAYANLLAESVTAKSAIEPIFDRFRQEISGGFRRGYDCLERLDPSPKNERAPAREGRAPASEEPPSEDALVRAGMALVDLFESRAGSGPLGVADLEAPGLTPGDRVEVLPIDARRYVVEIHYRGASPGEDLARRVLLHLPSARALGRRVLQNRAADLAAIRFSSRLRAQVVVLTFAGARPSRLLVVPAEDEEAGPAELAAANHLADHAELPVAVQMGEHLMLVERGT